MSLYGVFDNLYNPKNKLDIKLFKFGCSLQKKINFKDKYLGNNWRHGYCKKPIRILFAILHLHEPRTRQGGFLIILDTLYMSLLCNREVKEGFIQHLERFTIYLKGQK